jgi:hypothetical protein
MFRRIVGKLGAEYDAEKHEVLSVRNRMRYIRENIVKYEKDLVAYEDERKAAATVAPDLNRRRKLEDAFDELEIEDNPSKRVAIKKSIKKLINSSDKSDSDDIKPKVTDKIDHAAFSALML